MASGRVFEAVAVEEPIQDDDVYDSFNKWKGSFEDAESPGTIRAFRLPLDEQGRASHNQTGQIRLGAWPVDQYDFDSLCDKIIREFMLPHESMMAVRLIGTLAGKQGVRFNKIVTLQRSGLQALASPAAVAKDSISEVMRAIQESNERMMRMFQEMRPAGGIPGGNSEELMRTVAMMKMLNEPMMQMMGPLMAAVAGRPLGAGGGNSMKETIETMMMVDKFLGRRGGGGTPEPDWLKVTTAVAGVAKPLLEMAAQNKSATPARTRRAIAPPANPAAPAAQAPVSTEVPTPAPRPSPVELPMDRPSPLPMTPSLNPGPNIDAPTPQKADPMFSETKKQIDALVQVAEMGADPTAIADRFFEDSMLSLDDNAYGQLAGLIESDGFLNTIGIYNTKVAQFAEFFGKMRTRLIERIVAEDDPDLTT